MSRERSFACLPHLFYRIWSTLRLWRCLAGAGAGSVRVTSGPTGAQNLPPRPASWVWPRSANDVRAVCWHPEMWLLLFQVSPRVHSWLEPGRRRVPAWPGWERENRRRLLCPLCIVFRQFALHHGLLVMLLTAKPDFMGLWLRKENVHVNGWQHSQDCCILLGGSALRMYLFYQDCVVAKGGQIDMCTWFGS